MIARWALVAALAASLPLAGCGQQAADKAPAVSDGSIREQLAQTPRLRPGNYSHAFAIVRFDVPGLPPAQAQQLREAMAGAAAVQPQSCLSEEEARRGPERMFEQLAQRGGQCRFDRFAVAGETISGDMACAAQGGTRVTMAMHGTMQPEHAVMEMEQHITDPSLPQGRATMAFRVESRRTGDCAPATAGAR